ncbi:MAG: tnpA 3 [Geminicoccaceae bacterium]|jgi:transposase-like protein|nr:tnpA 3 [Geminicoccaceae bacterium]
MRDELLNDLPGDLPTFLKRFGSDARCRAYLVRARWPAGFRCERCGHDQAYSHKKRLIEECRTCGKQHSILAGTIFEQTKSGLAQWFLAIYLVTSSKGGISAMELKRQMGFGSYQTAWSWLHKIRRAMVRPERTPLAARVEADETYVGGPRPGRSGRGAGGKTVVAGAVESGRGKATGRRLGRLRLAVVADVSAKSLEGFLGQNVARPTTVVTDGWSGYGGLATAGYAHAPLNLSASWGDASLRLPAIHLVFGLAKRWLLGTHHGAVSKKHLSAYLDEFVFRFNRRTARCISHRFARLIQHAVQTAPITYRAIVAGATT